jgi:hypothetical protein
LVHEGNWPRGDAALSLTFDHRAVTGGEAALPDGDQVRSGAQAWSRALPIEDYALIGDWWTAARSAQRVHRLALPPRFDSDSVSQRFPASRERLPVDRPGQASRRYAAYAHPRDNLHK